MTKPQRVSNLRARAGYTTANGLCNPPGARVVPLPPYSPDLTPIEEMFSKVKGSLRSAAARTKETVYEAFGSALHDVTLDNIAGWFQDRAAYAMQL